jgi:hypothetical protein
VKLWGVASNPVYSMLSINKMFEHLDPWELIFKQRLLNAHREDRTKDVPHAAEDTSRVESDARSALLERAVTEKMR